MIVDCAHYLDGRRQHEEPMDLTDAAEMCSRESGFVWLGLFEPDEAELRGVQERFGLHELAVEDALSFHMRPKIERYAERDVLFAVFRTATYIDEREEIEFGEVSVFISQRFVITVRRGPGTGFQTARQRLENRPDLLREGAGAALWAIIDTVVDDYVPVIDGLDRDVEEVEATVFSGATAPAERIYLLRREATDFYRSVHPLLSPLDGLERGSYLGVSRELSQFFRDVNDHVKLITEEVAALRDALAMVLQANMAVISNEQTVINVRQNETMKVLTLVATIFLPLTFITGFFGMNFGWMVDHIRSFGMFAVAGVGSLLVSCALLFYWFHRAGHVETKVRPQRWVRGPRGRSRRTVGVGGTPSLVGTAHDDEAG